MSEAQPRSLDDDMLYLACLPSHANLGLSAPCAHNHVVLQEAQKPFSISQAYKGQCTQVWGVISRSSAFKEMTAPGQMYPCVAFDSTSLTVLSLVLVWCGVAHVAPAIWEAGMEPHIFMHMQYVCLD